MKKVSEKPLSRNNLPKHIKKGHKIVFSRQDLSPREADLFALMMAQMKSADWENTTPQYKFTAHQLSEWLNIDSKHVGSILRPVAERLSSYTIGIKVEKSVGGNEDAFNYKALFKNIRYENRELIMVPNDMLESEYIEYKQGFALITTKTYLDIKQEYAKRLYEILSRFKKDGYEMHYIQIEELKGLFGLLDERGNLKKAKGSFKNNGVFMERCIRSSIEKLRSNPITRKEFLFLESDNKELGYELKRQGNRISEIKFLVRWLDKGTLEELNNHDALKTIRELEVKRITKKQKLSIPELTSLMMAYRQVGNEEQAAKIEKALTIAEQENIENDTSDEEMKIMEQISSLIEQNDDIEY